MISLLSFTHADLHRSNIMVSQDANGIPFITAIIDWHQSGWYPASWEFYETRLTCKLPGDDKWELESPLDSAGLQGIHRLGVLFTRAWSVGQNDFYFT